MNFLSAKSKHFSETFDSKPSLMFFVFFCGLDIFVAGRIASLDVSQFGLD